MAGKGFRKAIQGLLGKRPWVDPEEIAPAPAPAVPEGRDNEVDILQFDGSDIRTIWIKGEQWWVAADVCAAIEIMNPRDAVSGLDADEKGVAQADTLRGRQPMAIVNEPGLYHLLGKSNKQKAKDFWRWVRHDVLTSIRKTGSYSVDQEAASKTPIRGWIRSRAKRVGFSPAWMKRRQKIADGNKEADGWTFRIGGDAMACVARYNTLYLSLFRRVKAEFKTMLNLKGNESPLDKMGDVPSAWYDAANCTLIQKMKDRSITIDNLVEKTDEIGTEARGTALKLLGPGYDFGPTEDAKGNTMLDVVRQLPKTGS